MAQDKAISGNPIRTGITVLQGGDVSASRISYSLTLRATAIDDTSNRRVVVSANAGNAKAYSGRVFGKLEAGNYIAIGLPYNIAGVADSTLYRSTTYQNPAFNKIENARITTVTDLAWDASGHELPVYTFTKTSSNYSLGTDVATTSRRITYTTGKPNPVAEAF